MFHHNKNIQEANEYKDETLHALIQVQRQREFVTCEEGSHDNGQQLHQNGGREINIW